VEGPDALPGREPGIRLSGPNEPRPGNAGLLHSIKVASARPISSAQKDVGVAGQIPRDRGVDLIHAGGEKA